MLGSFDVISIGAALIDMIAIVEEFPTKDGESFVHNFRLMPGGAAANVAVTCSRLGLKTAFVGKIGNDSFGELLIDDFQTEKVHTEKTLIISKEDATGSCYICVDKKGERIILAHSGAADKLNFDELPLKLLESSKWVHLSDLRNTAAIEAMLEKSNKLNFSLNPGALISQNPKKALALIEKASLVISSSYELTRIFDCKEDKIDTKTEQLYDNNHEKTIVITKGSRGATILTKKAIYEIPRFQVSVKDTTGAGDAFVAGMLFSLSKGYDLELAGRIASACSAICIENIGARSGPNSLQELVEFLHKNKVNLSL